MSETAVLTADSAITEVEHPVRFRWVALLLAFFGLLLLAIVAFMPVGRQMFDTFEVIDSFYYLRGWVAPAEDFGPRNQPEYPNLVADGIVFAVAGVVALVAGIVAFAVRNLSVIRWAGWVTAVIAVVGVYVGFNTRITPMPVRGYGLQPGGAPILAAVVCILIASMAAIMIRKRRDMLGLVPL